VNFNPTETTDISVNDSAHITCSLFSYFSNVPFPLYGHSPLVVIFLIHPNQPEALASLRHQS
jgi:hypothetical protein